jgi:formylglycine-generating enzyme required for sulfatase activity
MGRGTDDGGSDTATGSSNELPEHTVTVSPFRLDDFEVTVGRFRRFLEAYDGTPPVVGAGANPHIPDSGWQASFDSALPATQIALRNALFCGSQSTWTSTATSHESLPVNCTTWYEASAFCAWDGGRLPTEAEWEFAASGGSDNRLYPWGAEIPDDQNGLAVIDCAAGGTAGNCQPNDIPPVGSRPDGRGRYGQLDLAGSMMEQVLDWYDPIYYAGAEASGTDVADLNPTKPTFRVVRGGNYITPGSNVRSTGRTNVAPTSRFDGVGFRCARDK